MDRIIQEIRPTFLKKPKLKNVAAYARVSTGKDAMLHSLSAQVSYYSNLIQNHAGWNFCKVYYDEAITGTKDNRPGFQELIDECRKGNIDLVITKSVSRFARNTVLLLETTRELKGLGIDVYFEEQNINIQSAEGELMLTVIAAFAQAESFSASENVKWRVRKNFEKGIPWNGTILGYRIIGDKYVVVPNEAEIIKTIYNAYLNGMGFVAIAHSLNAAGLKTRHGNEWDRTSVQCILGNYSYTGNLLLQTTYIDNYLTKRYRINNGELPKYHIENSHEPIIPIEMFNAVQKERKRRSEKYYAPEQRNRSELTGRVVCGICGKNCRRKIRHGKPIWICNTYNTFGKEACPAKAVPESVLFDLMVYNPEKFILSENNTVITVSANDKKTEHHWEYASRRESWTPEMRARQGERSKAWHSAQSQ